MEIESNHGMGRSRTVGDLKTVASLVSSSCTTHDELKRMQMMLHKAGKWPENSSSEDDMETIRVNVAKGLQNMADDYEDLARQYALRALMDSNHRNRRKAHDRRTGELCEELALEVESRRVEATSVEGYLAHLRPNGSTAVEQLRDLQAKCEATATCCDSAPDFSQHAGSLGRDQMLELKHVVHTLATKHLACYAVEPGTARGASTQPATRFERRTFPRCATWRTPAETIRAYESVSRPRHVRLDASPRVWCISDLHEDAESEPTWSERLRGHPDDTLLVAGDVSTNLETLEAVLVRLKAKFKHVFFVPGNHEFWVFRGRGLPENSIEKLFRILELCDRLDVHTRPAFLGHDVLVVPLFSWYRRLPEWNEWNFDKSARTPKLKKDAIKWLNLCDMGCRWPWGSHVRSYDDHVADFFFGLNEKSLDWVDDQRARQGCGDIPIISMSHFVPLVEELAPCLKPLKNIMGCDDLDEQVARLGPRVHVFGHSHINMDEFIGTTRFVQHALGHPSDATAGDDSGEARLAFKPLVIWSTGAAAATPGTPRAPSPEIISGAGHDQMPQIDDGLPHSGASEGGMWLEDD